MWQPQRLVGAMLALVSAVLLLVSPFLPLFSGSVNAGTLKFTMTIDGWGFDTDAPIRFGAVAVNAFGLIFAAVLLFGAAIVSLAGARRRAATPATRRLATSVTAIAAAFTVGVVAMVLPQLTNWVDTFGPIGLGTADVETTIGTGFWLMSVGTVLALVAAVLTVRPVRDSEPATPPYGFPMPVMPQGQAQQGQAQSPQSAAESAWQSSAEAPQPAQPAAAQSAQPAPEAAQPNQPVPEQEQPVAQPPSEPASSATEANQPGADAQPTEPVQEEQSKPEGQSGK
nr:hypothetical protein [Kibdelosporangium sp. MJ126-NF4]CEL15187.1 hypothetical protein [Kibdelosporangium sp. MJ126-NF4]CTQ93217.1 FIG01038119: hypothetical protein [Kibdelosporangium sp. MJ126-NF4]